MKEKIFYCDVDAGTNVYELGTLGHCFFIDVVVNAI